MSCGVIHYFAVFKVNVSVEVFVENVNDNPPNFAQNHYVLDVNEVRHMDFIK